MITYNIKIFILLALLALSGMLLFSCAVQKSTMKHPTEVGDAPMCSECHTDWKAALDHLDHRPDYIIRHRFYAAQHRQACEVCHADSFCADCHAIKDEIKPSDKFKDSPRRTLPHRGDYINQHKIDGKINPASCFSCHGRLNNERCQQCHR